MFALILALFLSVSLIYYIVHPSYGLHTFTSIYEYCRWSL